MAGELAVRLAVEDAQGAGVHGQEDGEAAGRGVRGLEERHLEELSAVDELEEQPAGLRPRVPPGPREDQHVPVLGRAPVPHARVDVPLDAPRHDAGRERPPVEQEAQRGELGGAVLGRRHGRAHVVLDALGHREERVGGALGGALSGRGPGQPPKQEGRAAVGEVGPPQAQLQGPLARLEDARPGRLPEEQGQVLGRIYFFTGGSFLIPE